MKEHPRRQVNVLGIDVSVMRPEKAVNITSNYLNRKEVGTVYFHTAASSLFCQSQEWAANWIQSCDLVLAGDRNMENVVEHSTVNPEISAGNGLFADAYIKRLLHRLNRESREIFAVTSNESHLSSLIEYLQTTYPNLMVSGNVLTSEQEAEKVVNEINGYIPDIVFICLPSDLQLHLACHYQAMMNTHLIVCIESLIPLMQTETEIIPSWVESLHLTGLYQWFHKREKLQEKIVSSIFRKTVADTSNGDLQDLTEEQADFVEEQRDDSNDSDAHI